MKNKILICLGLLILPFFNSCEEETLDVTQPPAFDATVASVSLEFAAQGDETGFVYNINKSSGEEFWGTDELTYDINISSKLESVSQIAKIEFYAFLQEEVNGSYNYLGGNSGKLLTSITNPSKSFELQVSKSILEDMFQGEFTSGRSEIIPGELFELKWVITGTDGTVFDTRTDCTGFNCTYGISSEAKIVDTWLGEFVGTWIEVGSGTLRYSYTGVTLGAERTVFFTPGAEEGQYDVNDMAFGGAYGAARGGTLTYDAATNTLSRISVESYYASEWELVSVTPEVLTINWTNNWTARYAEYGTIEIRRNDGLTWPVGLTIVNL